MRNIEGYVCVISTTQGSLFLMGRPVMTGGDWESLMTNGLSPFERREAAQKAADGIRERGSPDFESVRLAKLAMMIAESDAEFEKLWKERKKGFVVLQLPGKEDSYPQTVIWGRPLPGWISTLYALEMVQNGMRPFITRFDTERCAREVVRQGLSRAVPAAFSLTYLPRRRRKKHTPSPR